MAQGTYGRLVLQNLVFLITDCLAGIPRGITSAVMSFDSAEVKAGAQLRHIGNAVVGYNGHLLSWVFVQYAIDDFTKFGHIVYDIGRIGTHFMGITIKVAILV